MTNDYFNHTAPLSRHTLGRAEAVNAPFSAIASGFEKLPGDVNLRTGKVTYAQDTGSANTIVVALPQTLTSYTDGTLITVKIAATNTGASTINVDSLGVRPIVLMDETLPLAGDLTAGDYAQFVCDESNTRWLLLSWHRSFTINSAASEQSAANSASAAATSLADFRTSFIGAFADDGAANSAGFSISEGTLYYRNTAPKGMRRYQDGAWGYTVFDANGALMAINNLSDLNDAPTARTNLGLGSTAVLNVADLPPRGLVPLAKSLITSSTHSVVFTLSSEYPIHVVKFTGVRNDLASQFFYLNTSTDGGATFDVTVGDYAGAVYNVVGTEVGQVSSQQYMPLVTNMGRLDLDAMGSLSGEIVIHNARPGRHPQFVSRAAGFANNQFIGSMVGVGTRTSTTTINAVRIRMNDPMFEGAFYFYGVEDYSA